MMSVIFCELFAAKSFLWKPVRPLKIESFPVNQIVAERFKGHWVFFNGCYATPTSLKEAERQATAACEYIYKSHRLPAMPDVFLSKRRNDTVA